MTLNRLTPELKKAFKELQDLYYLQCLSKSGHVLYYWQNRRLTNLYFKTIPLRIVLEKHLNVGDKEIILMRYAFKYPIKKIMERTGYCKRSILYHIKHSIEILEYHV